jgi:hypothetical protein
MYWETGLHGSEGVKTNLTIGLMTTIPKIAVPTGIKVWASVRVCMELLQIVTR